MYMSLEIDFGAAQTRDWTWSTVGPFALLLIAALVPYRLITAKSVTRQYNNIRSPASPLQLFVRAMSEYGLQHIRLKVLTRSPSLGEPWRRLPPLIIPRIAHGLWTDLVRLASVITFFIRVNSRS